MQRSIGLPGATGIGVGAIVGGGILALAGVAFAATGPSAILAFGLNGLIALITASSYAELATQFPESGGTYAFAKRILTIEAAFIVGWIVWFASIVACVLYAFGFGVFAAILSAEVWQAVSATPLTHGRSVVVGLGCAATLLYALGLLRRAGGGGHWINIGKILVFGVLIAAGLWILSGRPLAGVHAQLTPFFTGGPEGMLKAMGYTFITLQGFDLIAAMSGEVRDPLRILPRAMFLSLAIALIIYLPLLLVVATVGMAPGHSVTTISDEQPEAVVAIAARTYLGAPGYWLVLLAGVLSMLSALHSNLLAASRIAQAMGRDRTLPRWLSSVHPHHGTPVSAILVTTAIVIILLLFVPDMAVVGAASSLVFLVTFALVHRISILARRRGGVDRPHFRIPLFPVLQVVGLLLTASLALFQGVSVPLAGILICLWLVLGGTLYVIFFARRARAMDAFTQATDGELVRLRGRSPLVLVPIANPSNAEAMVSVATALAHPEVGRVLLLSVVSPAEGWTGDGCPPSLVHAQAVVRDSLVASFARGLAPEALLTVATQPWREIARVAGTHRCETLLLGLSNLSKPGVESRLEELIGSVYCDVVILRAPSGWLLRDVRRVLVPVGGQGDHDALRARLLASIHRLSGRQMTLLRVLPPEAETDVENRSRIELLRMAQDEVPGESQVVVTRSHNVAGTVAEHATEADLVVLGLQRFGQRHKVLGQMALEVTRQTACGVIMIGRRG